MISARFGDFGYGGWFAIGMFKVHLWHTPVTEAARACYRSLLPLCR